MRQPTAVDVARAAGGVSLKLTRGNHSHWPANRPGTGVPRRLQVIGATNPVLSLLRATVDRRGCDSSRTWLDPDAPFCANNGASLGGLHAFHIVNRRLPTFGLIDFWAAILASPAVSD